MLKDYMKKHHLTQAKVAADLGISQMQVSRILNGAPISAKIGIKIAEAYGLSFVKLVKGSMEAQSK